MIKKWTSNWLVALGCLAVFSAAMAAEPGPSGTVTLTAKVVAIGVGVTRGDGTLTVDGKTYPFSVEGLSVADVGVSDITTAIGGGPTDTIMQNQNNVVIRLHGTQKGTRLTLAAQGVTLKIK